ncbi:MAG: aldehyde dehydrogenase family protein, partial [Chitinophagales bacterium]
FWLSAVPMIGAMAAGNCVILKPSELTLNTSSVMKEMFDETFPAEFVAVAEGDAEVSQQLLNLPPDYIFFTGSTAVGKIVAQTAVKNLIPFTLELGGKSPCIIDETANVKLSVKRMMWGKVITSGQTCVAPDYLLVHEKILNEVVREIKNVLGKFYPGGAINDPDYPCIINEKNYSRLIRLMPSGKILLGGKTDDSKRKIEPTLLGEVSLDDAVMKEEIFGSLLPVIPFNSADDVIHAVNQNPNPLSLYIFSRNKKFQHRLLKELSFGGALINDTIEHLGNHYLPFGGIGGSGLGAYHGEFSFDTFSHRKAVMKKGTWIDLGFRYKPYSRVKERVMRTFLR